MKAKSFLSSICFILITTFLTAQAPDTYHMNQSEAIIFHNDNDADDGTEIIRQGGNSLQLRYFGSPLRFLALDDKPFQIRNSLNEVNIQLNSNAGKSYILGKLGINTDIVDAGYKLQVAGDIKVDETHMSKIKFLNGSGELDGTEIIKANGDALRIKYFGNNLIFDALDDNPIQLRNAANENMIQLSPNGSSYFLGGFVGFGTTTVQTPLHVKQSNEKGLRFERDGHETYELRLAGSTGFHIWNITNNVSEMVFNGNGLVGIGTTTPLSLLHLKQKDEKGLRFERDGHDTYELGVRGSQGLYVTNTTSGEYEMVFDDGSIGIGTNTPSNNAKLNIDGGTDAALSCPDCGYLVIGSVDNTNIAIDNNEILARNNGAISNLGLQADGGSLTVHGGSSIPDDEKFHISDSGNVGIGTISPSEALTVNGNILADDPATNLLLYRFLRAPDGAGNNLHIDASAGNDLYFNHYLGENIRFGFNGEKMVITSEGNVGIGAISPSSMLDIEKNYNGSTILEITNSDPGNLARGGISIGNGSPGSHFSMLSTSPNYDVVPGWQNSGVLSTDSQLLNGLVVRSSAGNIRFQPGGTTDEIVFDGNGNVGIGTDSPAFKLDVIDDSPTFRVRANVNDREIIIKPGDGNIEIVDGASTLHLNRWSSSPVAIAGGGGNVGIGIISPSAKLEVNGPDNDGNTGTIKITTGDQTMILDANEIEGPTDSPIHINNLRDQDVRLADGGGNVIMNGSGVVGIGTGAPETKLHVEGTTLLKGPDNDGISMGTLKLTTGTQTMLLDANEIDGPIDDKLHLNQNVDQDVAIAGGGGDVLINGGGRVGINTSIFPTDTNYKLAVDGNIISEELKVRNSNNWPDYVFQDDYQLIPLDKLEEYIQQNGHLPGMPTADEVTENGGIEVGDMQKQLLEKVEELTLYIIQQEKRIQELEQAIKDKR